MSPFEPRDPDYRRRVHDSFARQRMMSTLGASLTAVEPGTAEITLPFREDLTQQHGFVHAGTVATILDSACGYAAFSLMPAEAGVLTVEYKINLLAPAAGSCIVARGEVTRPGRSITVCRGDAFGVRDDGERLVAQMQATMMAVFDRPDVRG